MPVIPAPHGYTSPERQPLLPKLRGNFAEFLNEGSLARLSILYSPTCVGLRYDCPINWLEDFLGSRHQPLRPCRSAGSHSPLGVKPQRICLPGPPTGLDLDFQCQAGSVLASYVTPSLCPVLLPDARIRQYGNINPLSIDYAFRPRLRCRLTLGGRALPRKPWVFGVVDSHHNYRYSCRHYHFHTVHCLRSGKNQRPFQARFILYGTLLYHASSIEIEKTSVASVIDLSPDHFRRKTTRLVSYYALFK